MCWSTASTTASRASSCNARASRRASRARLHDPPTALMLDAPLQQSAWRFIVSHAGRPVRTSTLASFLNVTREHLSRSFAADNAPNLKRIIDLVRIVAAAELAKNPGLRPARRREHPRICIPVASFQHGASSDRDEAGVAHEIAHDRSRRAVRERARSQPRLVSIGRKDRDQSPARLIKKISSRERSKTLGRIVSVRRKVPKTMSVVAPPFGASHLRSKRCWTNFLPFNSTPMSHDIAVFRRPARTLRSAGALTVVVLFALVAAVRPAHAQGVPVVPDTSLAVRIDTLIDLPTAIARALDVSPLIAASEGVDTKRAIGATHGDRRVRADRFQRTRRSFVRTSRQRP